MAHREVDKNMVSTNGSQKEWRPPVLRKLPIAETSGHAGKITPGNEGVGGGKGDNATVIS
jgi:hypothetical protein